MPSKPATCPECQKFCPTRWAFALHLVESHSYTDNAIADAMGYAIPSVSAVLHQARRARDRRGETSTECRHPLSRVVVIVNKDDLMNPRFKCNDCNREDIGTVFYTVMAERANAR